MLDSKFVVVGMTLLAFITGFFINLIMLRNGYLLDLANVQEREDYDGATFVMPSPPSVSIPTPEEIVSLKTVTATVTAMATATATVTATVTKTVTAKETVTATVTKTVTKEIEKPAPSCAPPSQESPATSSNNDNSNATMMTTTTTTEPFCHRNYKFIIMSVQRSGTHYLTETLQLNPDLYIPSEIFKGDHTAYFKNEYNITAPGPGYTQFGRKELASILAELVYGVGPSWARNNDHFPKLARRDGFILHHGQVLNTPQLLPMISEMKGWKAIHLVRQNGFHRFVSKKMLERSAEHAAHCHVNATCESHNQTLTLDLQEMLGELKRHDRIINDNRRWLKEYRIPSIEVIYEELLSGEASFCDLWKFCECTCVPMKPISMVKNVNRKYSDIVQNYYELKAAVKRTPYVKYFDE